MIKGSIQKEDIKIINIYASNIGAPQYIRQMLTIKGEIDSNTIILGDLILYLQQRTDHPDRNLIKETQALNDTLDQTDLIGTYRTFHPKAAEYTFFSSAHKIFSRIDHTLETNLNNIKRIDFIQSMFTNHKGIK